MTSTPHSNGLVRAIGVVRISTIHQRDESLDAQERKCRELAVTTLGREPEWTWIRSQGSGERLDRPELDQLKKLIDEGGHQFIFAEASDRIMRDAMVTQLLDIAHYKGVRAVMGNGVDTADPNWKIPGTILAVLSELEQSRTSARIKRQLPHEFENGKWFGGIPWGYRHRPPEGHQGPTLETHVVQDPDLKRIYLGMVERLEQGATYADVARWLNTEGIAPPGTKFKRWQLWMVSRIIANPVYTGLRVFGKTETVKNPATGHRKPRARKGKPLTRMVEHLRMIDPDRHALLRSLLETRNGHLTKSGGREPNPKDRGRVRLFPSQIMRCAICGELCNSGSCTGLKSKEAPLDARRLTCGGKRRGECWMSPYLHYPTFIAALFRALTDAAIEAFEDSDVLRALLAEEVADLSDGWRRQVEAVRKEQGTLEQSQRNLLHAIERCNGDSASLVDRLREIERQLGVKSAELRRLEADPPARIEVPSSEEICSRLREIEHGFDPIDGHAAAQLLTLAPRMTVYPFRLPGGKTIYPFVFVELDLSRFCRPAEAPAVRGCAVRRVMIPAFRAPVAVRVLGCVRAMTADGLSPTEQSVRLKTNISVVKEAMELLAFMDREGRPSPFIPLSDPSTLEGNGRYRKDVDFRPVEGHTPWNGDTTGLPPLPDLSE